MKVPRSGASIDALCVADGGSRLQWWLPGTDATGGMPPRDLRYSKMSKYPAGEGDADALPSS